MIVLGFGNDKLSGFLCKAAGKLVPAHREVVARVDLFFLSCLPSGLFLFNVLH